MKAFTSYNLHESTNDGSKVKIRWKSKSFKSKVEIVKNWSAGKKLQSLKTKIAHNFKTFENG